ncbi:MAG: hypothetical protein KY464_05365 [Gemmatimonadetes bacterium]|nr:hypothetical protein [Gemmatimonadota bacterium]
MKITRIALASLTVAVFAACSNDVTGTSGAKPTLPTENQGTYGPKVNQGTYGPKVNQGTYGPKVNQGTYGPKV